MLAHRDRQSLQAARPHVPPRRAAKRIRVSRAKRRGEDDDDSRMLLGLMRPTEGQVHIFNKPLKQNAAPILRKIGALVEAPALYPHLTGYENLEVTRRLIGGRREQIQRALSIVDMERDAHRLVRGYSSGMRQRLALARCLMGEPRLLILDEPTNGLDPAGIHEIRELIRKLPQEQEVTVFLSSHLLAEVEQVAAHLGIINQGKLLFQGTLALQLAFIIPPVIPLL